MLAGYVQERTATVVAQRRVVLTVDPPPEQRRRDKGLPHTECSRAGPPAEPVAYWSVSEGSDPIDGCASDETSTSNRRPLREHRSSEARQISVTVDEFVNEAEDGLQRRIGSEELELSRELRRQPEVVGIEECDEVRVGRSDSCGSARADPTVLAP
jgi:hypothetical protein